VIDVDATLVVCHSEKQGCAATFKHTYGYHPVLAWLDNTVRHEVPRDRAGVRDHHLLAVAAAG
jgi:hypothetical protein